MPTPTPSSLADSTGLPVSTRSRTALDASERALWRMMSFYGAPLDDLDAAIAADPGWSLPHAMKGGFLLSLTEPSLLAEARGHVERAAGLARARGDDRERAHVGALRRLADGDWQGAAEAWGGWLDDHPRDALALQWAHLVDFYRGDAAALEGRIARALPSWDASDRWRPFVVAMHAFGLEERGRYAEAEAAGREALDAEERVPWAIHAVAHVMEMEGRHGEGARWMHARRRAWGLVGDDVAAADRNGFAGHLGWHEALFALESLDHAAALALFDRYLAPASTEITLQRVDAASLLWRLRLHGADVGDRFAALVAGWPLDAGRDAGLSTFNDLHVVLARIGAGDVAGAREWAAAARARAPGTAGDLGGDHGAGGGELGVGDHVAGVGGRGLGDLGAGVGKLGVGHRGAGGGELGVGDRGAGVGKLGIGHRGAGVGDLGLGDLGLGKRASGRRGIGARDVRIGDAPDVAGAADWNRSVMRDVGGTLLDGVLAFGEECFDAAVDALSPALPGSARIGGSHAQRDVLAQTLLAAAASGGRASAGRVVLEQRSRDRPTTPLTEHWRRRLA